jgi:hypothetical protein
LILKVNFLYVRIKVKMFKILFNVLNGVRNFIYNKKIFLT